MTEQRSFDARYGILIRRDGIATVPAALFRYQAALGLSVPECWFLCVVLSYRWNKDAPYPSLGMIAERAGVTERVLHKYLASLKERGLVNVVARFAESGFQLSSAYELDPLFERLEELILNDVEKPGSGVNGHSSPSEHPFTPRDEQAFRAGVNGRSDEVDPPEIDPIKQKELRSIAAKIADRCHEGQQRERVWLLLRDLAVGHPDIARHAETTLRRLQPGEGLREFWRLLEALID